MAPTDTLRNHSKNLDHDNDDAAGDNHDDNNDNNDENRFDEDDAADDSCDADSGTKFGRKRTSAMAVVVIVVVVWMVMTCSRVVYVTNPRNWWVLHPDENFQSLEVAHTLAYGYGFRPYEFSTLPGGRVNSSSEQTSIYRQRELELGMSTMRSALYPRFYVVISCLATIFCPDVKPFVLWKVAHALVSSLLPLCVFRFTKAYFRSQDAACLAAILVATSSHLNVLGTHPLLNSFLSPAVFWCLSQLLPLVQGSSGYKKTQERACSNKCYDLQLSSQGQRHIDCSSKIPSPSIQNGGSRAGTQATSAQHLKRNAAANLCHRQNGKKPHATSLTSHFANIIRPIFRVDVFIHKTSNTKEFVPFVCGFVLALCVYMRMDVALFAAVVVLPKYRPAKASYRRLLVCAGGSLAGIALGVLEDFYFYNSLVLSPGNWSWFNVVRNMPGRLFGRSTPWTYVVSLCANNAGLPSLFALHGAACVCFLTHAVHGLVTRSDSQGDGCERDSHSKGNAGQTCGSSVTSARSIVKQLNRVNSVVSRKSTSTSALKNNKHSASNPAITNGKAADSAQNKAWLNNTKNIGLGLRKTTNKRHMNNNKIKTNKNSRETNQQEHSSSAELPRRSCYPVEELSPSLVLTACWVFLLLMYSCKDHKELRFVHNPLVLAIITSAGLLSALTRRLQDSLSTFRTHCLLGVILLLWAGDQWRCFPACSEDNTCLQPWAYRKVTSSQDVNACLAYLADQRDVTGVFIDSPFQVTGGFSLLRHEVPVLTLLVQEFVELDVIDKVTLPQRSALDASSNVSYVTVDRLSNFVTVHNAGYLLRPLVQNRRYNYLVLPRDRRFLHTGYEQVLERGAMRVLKRTFHPRHEQELQTLAARVPVGKNATVLRYEGDVLFRFHRFTLALERYLAAFQLSPAPEAHVFQALAACKAKLGDQSQAKQWVSACVQRFGIEDCSRPLTIRSISADRPVM